MESFNYMRTIFLSLVQVVNIFFILYCSSAMFLKQASLNVKRVLVQLIGICLVLALRTGRLCFLHFSYPLLFHLWFNFASK